MILRTMFSRQWIFTTLLVFAGTAFCARLGIWQLDRLEQRRAFNAQVESMRATTPLDLNNELPENISEMEWRAATVTGQYDFENQVALRNQYNGDQYGYHLITPLLFNGTAVLVDRGFIPADGNSAPSDWREYDEEGMVTVTGQIRLGQGKPAFGGVADALTGSGEMLFVWNNLNVAQISEQLEFPILNIYIQQNLESGDAIPPIPFQPVVELTEGSHFGYALQWFTFAVMLFAGYPFYLRKQD
ncbi:MAG: SURF1 family protein [Chloroflexi bacterium]|nr:SURF1 family protein [Chloroflexota bacterium]